MTDFSGSPATMPPADTSGPDRFSTDRSPRRDRSLGIIHAGDLREGPPLVMYRVHGGCNGQ
jgi:hypothetical protein